MPSRVEIKVVASAHLRRTAAEHAVDGSRDVAAAAVAVRLHRVDNVAAFGESARKLEKFETPERDAVLMSGGTTRVVAWDQAFAFTESIGRPEELVATFKVSEGEEAIGEASASLEGLGDARLRESWLPLRTSDMESDIALDKGFLHVVLLYVATPRVEVCVRDGDGYFGTQHDMARVQMTAIGLVASSGSPRADGTVMVERQIAVFGTRSMGGLPNPQWEQTFVVPELADAQLVLEFESTCGDAVVGKARLSFEELPAEALCDATITTENGTTTAVCLCLRSGTAPDMVGLASEDFLEAIDDLDDGEVTATLSELGAEIPEDATANAQRQRLRLLYGPRELRLSVRRIVGEDSELPSLGHSVATTPISQLQPPVRQQRDVCAIFVCEKLNPILDHHHGVAYAVMKRTVLRPDFVEESTASGFVHKSAAGHVEAGTTVRVTQVRLGHDGRVHCHVVGKNLHARVQGSSVVEGWAAAEDKQGQPYLRPIPPEVMFTPVEMHVHDSTVIVQPPLSAAGESSAMLKLRLDQLYAWETTIDGGGFCFRLSEGDADVGLVDRAAFRMRGSEGQQLVRLLDRAIRRRRDAGMRHAGLHFCTSALDPASGMSVAVNPMRRNFAVGFAVVVVAQSDRSASVSPIVEMLEHALYTVTTVDNLESAVEQCGRTSSDVDGKRGLLLVRQGFKCFATANDASEFDELGALATAGKLPKGVAVVVVLAKGAGATSITDGALRELVTSPHNKLAVLVEPVQAGEIAQLCWLLPSPQLRRSLDTSKISGEWKVALGSSQQLKDKLTKPLQRKVGGKKTRFVDKENNLDLNLCYITKTCIAMGLPADATEGLIRNNIKEVARFFDIRHPDGTFKIFNLCIERTYDCSYFRDQVGWFPCPDHNVPPLHMLHNLAMSAHRFLQRDERNVIAMHCKGGKGRTGTAVCAHLVQHWKLSAAQALLAYENARTTGWSVGSTEGSQGVTGASQIRYVHYYERILREGRERELDAPPVRRLTAIHLEHPPQPPAGDDSQYFVWCTAECNYQVLFRTVPQPLSVDSAMLALTEFQVMHPMSAGGGADTKTCRTVQVAGDIFFSFFLHRAKRGILATETVTASNRANELLAEVWLHTSFAGEREREGEMSTTTLRRDELDIKLKSLPISTNLAIGFGFCEVGDRPSAPVVASAGADTGGSDGDFDF